MTVLSPSTVAISMSRPSNIEIWDWKAGKRVRRLSGFGGHALAVGALLPDVRFVAGNHAGILRVGFLDNWAGATVIDSGASGITRVLTGHDGSLVTTNAAGDIKLWRNGACEVTLTGVYPRAWFTLPLAVIGRRLIFPGEHNTLLVAE